MIVRKPRSPKRVSALAAMALIFTLSGAPDVLAQNASAQPQSQPQGGVTVDPSQAPLQPSQTTLPDAPSATPEEQSQPVNEQPHTTMTAQPSTPESPAPSTRQQAPPAPVGSAAAQNIRTTGGGASRPAGSAIAPAKQRQTRSLLIKMGLVAAAGVAIGTVYALSHGTSSTPPNTR